MHAMLFLSIKVVADSRAITGEDGQRHQELLEHAHQAKAPQPGYRSPESRPGQWQRRSATTRNHDHGAGPDSLGSPSRLLRQDHQQRRRQPRFRRLRRPRSRPLHEPPWPLSGTSSPNFSCSGNSCSKLLRSTPSSVLPPRFPKRWSLWLPRHQKPTSPKS